MHEPLASPWFFFRDHFDYVEEELDAVFHAHEHGRSHGRVEDMEDEVLDEQIKSEERIEKELDRALGEPPPHTHPPAEDRWIAETRPLKQLLRDAQIRDPLYVRALGWGRRLYSWSGKLYYGSQKDRDLFRIHINATLIPMKIALAQTDSVSDEPSSLLLAAKGYELAHVYAERTLESLKRASEQPWAIGLNHERELAEGAHVVRELARLCQSMNERLRFRGLV